MNKRLKLALIEILTYFKTGLDDIEEGSGERQQMQDEIDYALPLVKNTITSNKIGSSLDLEKLERKFDEILDKETKDSLETWLHNTRTEQNDVD